ncbi:MAG TPA: hypothetical protein VE957_10180 [Terriglobales bacterium]|nr:hypothetical protein [Terriglobales bacterium]
MTTINRTTSFAGAILALGTLLLAIRSYASPGDFYPSYPDAKVIAHLTLSGASPRQMFLQQAGRKQYLYLQQPAQEGFTVVDVTKPTKPKIVSHVPQENITMVSSGLAIAEKPDNSAAVGASRAVEGAEGARGGGNGSESVRVLDVSDPVHPRTVQTFSGVTSVLPDNARSLIYVANGEGIWILSHQQVLRRHLCSSSDAISSAIPNCD